MSNLPESVLESFRENGFYVLEIPPYHGQSYAIIPKDELDSPDDFDPNKMTQYNGFSITPLKQY